MDVLVRGISSGGRFPKLGTVTVGGFSSGAEMVLGWAYFSSLLEPTAHESIKVRVVAGDPDVYTYLDAQRPAASCSPPDDTGVHHTCHAFAEPPEAFRAACPNYDDYPYGMANPGKYPALALYIATAKEGVYGKPWDTASVAGGARDIRYIFGSEDVCNCGAGGPALPNPYSNPPVCTRKPGHGCVNACGAPPCDAAPDCCDSEPDMGHENAPWLADCTGMVQGESRLQRGLNFMSYQRQLSPASHKGVTWGIFDGGHSATAFTRSDLFQEWAYGE
jgi:hypothetical protein